MLLSALASAVAATCLTVGLHVPWATPEPQLRPDGSVVMTEGEWPAAPVEAVRLWDTRTGWLHLEQAQDRWNFSGLDAKLAAARGHGVRHVTLVLWGTPRWAARDEAVTDASWLGPGSAAVPASLADWDDYVRTVATRYRGRIDAYQLGNEVTSTTFFRGTPAELGEMVRRAAAIIHEEDPAATVVAPSIAYDSALKVPSDVDWYRVLAGSGVDALSFHYYPVGLRPDQLTGVARRVRQVAAQAGLPSLPLWVTEVGYQSVLFRDQATVSQLPERTRAAAQAGGVSMLHWYAWSSLPIGNLVPLGPGSRLDAALSRSLSRWQPVSRVPSCHPGDGVRPSGAGGRLSGTAGR